MKRELGLDLNALTAESIISLQTEVGRAGSTIAASLPGAVQATLLLKVQMASHAIAVTGAGGGRGTATGAGAGCCSRITSGRTGAATGTATGSGAGTISTFMQSSTVTPASFAIFLAASTLTLQPASRSFISSNDRASSNSWQFLSTLLPPRAKPNAAL